MKFTLRELQAQFLKYELEPRGAVLAVRDKYEISAFRSVTVIHKVDTLAEANGISFLCPKCFANTNGNVKETHSVICWSRTAGAPEFAEPHTYRWKMSGTNLDDLTLRADNFGGGGSPNVFVVGMCEWNGLVMNGFVE